jgi:putative ABC transport system substrate-binding protein
VSRLVVGLAAFLAVLGSSLDSAAQGPARVPRVGVLHPGSPTETPTVQREPFERGLRDLGWIPGSSVAIEYRYADGRVERLSALAAELVELKVDVIVARGSVAIAAARQVTSSIPIVMSSGSDPVTAGHVRSLARPGGNVTGIANLTVELDAKRLELLKEALPGLARVGVLDNVTSRRAAPGRELGSASRVLGLDIQSFAITRTDELGEAFAKMARARIGALLLHADPLVLEPNRSQVTALAAKSRVPVMYPWRVYVDVGGLMSYSESIPAFHFRSASYVDRILRGASPAVMPVEQPAKFDLVVNLKAARAIELSLPHDFLLRADEVID